jgi:hypothetical protein
MLNSAPKRNAHDPLITIPNPSPCPLFPDARESIFVAIRFTKKKGSIDGKGKW